MSIDPSRYNTKQTMFNSISKVWSEVADETDAEHSVRFSPSTRGANTRRNTDHYIHYDNPPKSSTTTRRSILKNPMDRVRSMNTSNNSTTGLKIKGSPRILKPVTESRYQKLNNQGNKSNESSSGTSGLWGALGKLGKVFKPNDNEIGSMKNYMNGMIPEVGQTTSHGVKRPADLAKTRLESIKQRAELVNQRAARFISSEKVSPERKRQRTVSLQEPTRNIRRIQLKDLEDLESSRDNIKEKINRRGVLSATAERSTQRDVTSQPKLSSDAKFNINDVPSSPMRDDLPVAAGTPAVANAENDSTVNVPQSTLNHLTRKLQLLENTVESLKEELKVSNERSQHLEVSLNEVKREQEIIDNTILKSEELEKIEFFEPYTSSNNFRASTPLAQGPVKNDGFTRPSRLRGVQLSNECEGEDDDEFEEVNRSLSPVKLDLHKFKYIK